MPKVVETFANISANDLLNTSPRLFGWVRKVDNSTGLLSVVKKLDGWPWYYMILRTGCLYLFKKSNSTNFTEAIPLTIYRVCDAPDITKYSWVFKLIHSTEVKTLFFAVDTEFDLKKWKDAIINEKDEYTDDAGHNYCKIDDPSDDSPYFGEPLPQPPPPSRKLLERPPAPLPAPSLPQRRPYSISLPPEPLAQYNQTKNAPLPPPKQHSPQSLISPVHKKPVTLPRPLPAAPRKPNPPAKDIRRRTSSASCLEVKPETGFDNVIKQLGSTRLSHDRERDAAPPPPQSSPTSGVLRSNSGSSRRPPDGCESSKLKHPEMVGSPKYNQQVSEAYQKDMTKESASRALKSEFLRTYLTRPGNSEAGISLSFRDENEDGTSLIRHYKIFYTESLGYALETKGPRFDGISQMLEHYCQHKPPNTETKLRYPFYQS